MRCLAFELSLSSCGRRPVRGGSPDQQRQDHHSDSRCGCSHPPFRALSVRTHASPVWHSGLDFKPAAPQWPSRAPLPVQVGFYWAFPPPLAYRRITAKEKPARVTPGGLFYRYYQKSLSVVTLNRTTRRYASLETRQQEFSTDASGTSPSKPAHRLAPVWHLRRTGGWRLAPPGGRGRWGSSMNFPPVSDDGK